MVSFPLLPALSPLNFSASDLALQQGNGNAVFDFKLNTAEANNFDALLLAGTISSTSRIGLSSELGCPTGAAAGCLPSVDGPDSFLAFAQSQVPAPVVEAGLPGLIAACGGLLLALARRRRRQLVA